MAHKAIWLFRNICSHTRPLNASISMFRPSERKSGENTTRWGEFCEGCGRRIPGNNTPVAGNGQSRRNFDTLGISPVESTEITGTYDISLPFPRKCRIIFARIITCTYNFFLTCNSKYNTVKEEI